MASKPEPVRERGAGRLTGRVEIVVHGDLVDHVARGRGASGTSAPLELERPIEGTPGVKDVLEAAGIPHPEIAALTVNGEAAELGRRLTDGDRVEAWPADLALRLHLEPAAPPAAEDAEEPRFVLDGHLGRLAAYLRMLGFDTWYRTDADDDELADVAAGEGRILLTRDRGLLRRSIVRRGAFLRSDRPVEQLVEASRRFGLVDRWRPFGRCIRCNTPLETVSRDDVLDRLEPLTRIHYDEFRHCPGCDAVYWKGSHHERMTRLIDRVRIAVGASDREG